MAQKCKKNSDFGENERRKKLAGLVEHFLTVETRKPFNLWL
jgi:hypothetical protein